MLTTMVSGYYDVNDTNIYQQGPESYGEYCYNMQDVCSQVTCAYHGPPAGVRMLSNGSSIPMPLQVPPGHLVQQVVDDNGTVRHILFSSAMPVAVGPHYSPNHASSTMPAPAAYYTYPQHPYTVPPHFHPQPAGHLQAPMSHQGMMLQPPTSQQPQCNGQAPPPTGASPPPPTPANQLALSQKPDRYQRQTYKFRRKTDGRSKEAKLVILPNPANSLATKKERRKSKLDDSLKVNSSSGSNASEDEDASWYLSEYVSNMRPPTVTEVTSRSAMFSWKPPDIPAGDVEKKLCLNATIIYDLVLCEKSREGHYKTVYSGSDLVCTISTLKPSTEYYIGIQAFVDDIKGNLVKGPVFKTPSSDSDVPQSPRLAVRTRNTLTVKWNPTSDLNGKVKNYVLEFDEGSGGANFVTIYSGPLKQHKVTKLAPATCYKFRLAAIYETGKSPYSPISMFYTCGNAPSQPSPPLLKQAFLNRLHLEWEKRNTDNDFCLQIEEEHLRHGFLTAYSGRETSFTCSGLRGNTEYKFRLCANNEEGSSPWSKIVAFCTLPDKLSCPGKPLPKGKIHASCFRVMWDPPKDNKQSSITKYILEIDKGFGFEAVYTGQESEFFMDNLLPGSAYKLRVACISSAGHSPYSEVSSIATASVNPGKCASPKLQSKPEASFLCLEWAHPEYDGGSAISEYEVDVTGPDNETSQAYRGSETSCIVNGLMPGRPYLFQVRAYNRVGAGPWSDSLQVLSGAGAPDPPRNLHALDPTPHGCLLIWEEPLNNGAAVTSYQLQMMNFDENSDDEENYCELYEGLCSSYEVKGLSPATKYSFRIRASNDAGTGQHSEVLVHETPVSTPGVIGNVNVCASATALHFTWTEPTRNGLEIQSYNVELDDYLYNTEGNVPELCIEDLLPETHYRVRIQAVNSLGEGPFSDPLEVATLCSPPDPPALECVSIGHNFLRLRWGEGKNTSFSCFTVDMCSRNKSFVQVYHGSSLTHKINRLQENTTYQFRICATGESGQGPYSELFTFQTSLAPPPLLRPPKVTFLTDSSCFIEWLGTKQLIGHNLGCSYQLQLLTENCSEPNMVYQGTDTKFKVENLEQDTRYGVRVAAVRHQQEEEFVGVFSPCTAFATLGTRLGGNEVAAAAVSAATPSYTERRTVRDRQWAAALVVAFCVVSFLFAVAVERFWDLSGQT